MDDTLSKSLTQMIYENTETRSLSESIHIANMTELKMFIKVLLKKFKPYFDVYLQHVAYATQYLLDVEYISNAIWSVQDEITNTFWEHQFKLPAIPDSAWSSVDLSILNLLTTAHLNCIAHFRGLSNDYPRSMLLDFLTASQTRNCKVIEVLESIKTERSSLELNFSARSHDSYVEQLLEYADNL